MRLLDLIERQPIPEPWSEGEKIPWNDAGFSRRMLVQHLSQAHDAASRRAEKIDQHVAWIHRTLLAGEATQILDLGCGPGLYAVRLTRLGHRVVGIDFHGHRGEEARCCRIVEPVIARLPAPQVPKRGLQGVSKVAEVQATFSLVPGSSRM